MYGLRVTIVGAGIGGLAAGIAFRRHGYEVAIYERAPELVPIGAGICMWPNGAKAVNELGLEAVMEARSPILNRIRYLNRSGEVIHDVPCAPLLEVSGVRPYPLTRADLHLALLGALGRTPLHLGYECVGVEQDDGGVTVHFLDGSSARTDVLVAADGVKSVIRDHVAKSARLRYLYSTWVGIAPEDEAVTPRDTFTFYTHTTQRAGVLPVSEQRMYFFFDAPVPEDWRLETDTRTNLHALFEGWPAPLTRLIDKIEPNGAPRLPVADLDPLATYVRGRVALIGDAAHATAPTLGQGGALAMEDALVLARYLATTSLSIEDALARYDAARRARVAPIVLAARARARAMVHGGLPDDAETHELVRNGSRPEAFIDVLAKIANTGPLG